MAGDWAQHQVFDGTYNFDDLLDWHEMSRVKGENQKRMQEYREMMKGME